MRCPNCNAVIARGARRPESLACARCGWGGQPAGDSSGSDAGATDPLAGRPTVRAIVLGIGWIWSVAFFVIPLGWLWFYETDWPAWTDVVGAFALLAYVGAAWVSDVRYDQSECGLFGGLIDNPFSYEDDWERFKRSIVLTLLPGKLIVYTWQGTLNLLLGR